MSHPIIEGTVQLLKIVTPGAYWIKCDACEGSCRTPTSIRHKPCPSEIFYPQQGEKVFVRDEDAFFYRGTVCGRRVIPNSEFLAYIVQLTDTFQVRDFDQHDVYPTYGESSAACQSAHLVSLYHVLPQMPPVGYGKCTDSAVRREFENAVANWDRSVSSLSHLIGGNVKFCFEQSKLIIGSIYGAFSTSPPLLTKTHRKCYYLSDYLHFEKLAIKMTCRFEAVIGVLMSNPLGDRNKLLTTFDPFGTGTSKPKHALPLDEPSKPIDHDFTGFRVHPDDAALHQGLISQEFYINILYTAAVPKRDTVVRYLSPDGNVVLGTVLNFAVECGVDYSDYAMESLPNGRKMSYFCSSNETTELCYSDELFMNFPPVEFPPRESPLSVEPGKSLLSYDIDVTCRNFQAAGGFFEDQFLPYPRSPAVEKLIAQNFDSLGIESLHDWQKLCLPSLSCRKNLAVLGPKSAGKLTTAIMSALSWMSYVNPSQSDSIHPQLILFVHDFNRAVKAGLLFEQLTDFRVIVSTSTFISKKQKELAINGCDVLITTPSNWAKLVSEIVFDYSRLNYVIFDGFDSLHEIYAEDVMNILDALNLPGSRRIQVVLVSNSWGAFIGDRNIEKFMSEFQTVCIMDSVLSCLYCKLIPTAVFIERNDWIGHLKTLSMSAAKRLLLCKDEEEGRLIIEKTSHIDRVLFAHENLHKNDALNIVREWDGNGDKLLVCTDNYFEHLGFLKDVGVMISWMTSSWNTLCSRFKAFSHAAGSKKGTSFYLFCDCENLEELLLIKNISNSIRCINGELVEHLNRTGIQAEYYKRTHICPSIFMFGKCKNVPLCPLRHVFLPDDNPEVPNWRQFLNVDILRVHSACRYSVRVREVMSNYDHGACKNTYILISKLKEIENGLAESSRKHFPPKALEIGQMVGACIVTGEGDSLLRRVIVKTTPDDGSSDLYCLSLVDFEDPDVHLPLSELFLLPGEVAKYPKDVVDLYIAGLMPADFKSDWQNDTNHYVMNTMNHVLKASSFLAGNVVMVTPNRSVLVDTLHCFRELGPCQKTALSITNSDFCSLKDLILASGLCVKNVTHLPLLHELLVKTASASDRPVRSLPLNPVGKYGCRTDLPTSSVPAVVSSYLDPGLLYVQLSAELEKLRNFEKLLSSALEHSKRKLPLIALDELCAVQYKGVWNRALIFDILADLENPFGAVKILFVDHGDAQDVQPHELYCLPEDFVTVPFFAIQCELSGIKPFRDEKWHPKAVEAFSSYIRTTYDEVENLLVCFCGTRKVDEVPSYHWRYRVILSHPSDPDHSINYDLARRGFVSFDPETKHVLNKSLTNGHVSKRFHELVSITNGN